ncbi:dipeptidase [Lentimicrobium sp.]|jgi:membrane dipeptidase|uniref:dipeptidase n=1 Tax=Lentimicrobium sp. TaxID=2034841 RepID=UPI002BB873C4|nr:dipeptidase [Lentimicrobium sp.]HPR27066.1 dipeptidase [Lentimicrobium sp.]
MKVKHTQPLLMLLALMLVISVSARNDREPELNRKAARIHARALTIDSHNDTPMWFTDTSYNFAEDHRGKRPRNRVDIPGMEAGGLDGAFFAVFVGQGDRDEKGNARAFEQAVQTFGAIERNLKLHRDKISAARFAGDARRIEKEKKRAIYIGLENGYPLGNDPGNVELFYGLGARYITLCHTRNNDICDSSTDSTEHNGISEFGETVVAEMNRLGMMVDVSHISDKAFYDAIRLSKTPVIASHSCARALCDNPRNLDDAMLRALAENGGVIQMCILSNYVKTPDPNPRRDSAQAALRLKYNGFRDLTEEEMNKARKEWYAIDDIYPQKLATVSDVADHIDHIVKTAGIRHVGIGTDFDGGGGVEGCADASELGNITLELVKRGYSARQIRLIWSKNLLRVMRETEKYARKNADRGGIKST